MLTDGKHLNILWSWPVWWTVWNHCFPLFSHHFYTVITPGSKLMFSTNPFHHSLLEPSAHRTASSDSNYLIELIIFFYFFGSSSDGRLTKFLVKLKLNVN